MGLTTTMFVETFARETFVKFFQNCRPRKFISRNRFEIYHFAFC